MRPIILLQQTRIGQIHAGIGGLRAFRPFTITEGEPPEIGKVKEPAPEEKGGRISIEVIPWELLEPHLKPELLLPGLDTLHFRLVWFHATGPVLCFELLGIPGPEALELHASRLDSCQEGSTCVLSEEACLFERQADHGPIDALTAMGFLNVDVGEKNNPLGLLQPGSMVHGSLPWLEQDWLAVAAESWDIWPMFALSCLFVQTLSVS